jgi:xanthine dehydrogenase accessory factor
VDTRELPHFGIADAEAWGIGLPCGGEIDVWVHAYEPGPFEVAARSGARAAEVTLLAGPQAGAKLVITPHGGRIGSLGSAEADAEAASVASELLWTEVSTRRGDLFIDVVGPAPRLSRPTLNALSYSTAGYREVGRGQLAGTEVVYFEKTLA